MKIKSYLFCFITIVFFSTYEIFGKLAGANIPAAPLTFLRFFIGGFLLLPFAIIQKKKNRIKLSKTDYLKISFIGFLNVALSMLFLQLSVFYGNATIAAVLISSNPIFVAFFAIFLLKEKVNLKNFLGLFIGIIGLIVIILGSYKSLAETRNLLLGIIFGILSSASFALYTVFTKKNVRQYGNILLNSIAFILGAFILLILSAILGMEMKFDFNINNLLIIFYLGIFVTGLAYVLYFKGLENISAAKGSVFFYLKPVITGILAFLIFREKVHFLQYVGFIIIIIGINIELIHKKIIKKRRIYEK